MAYADFSLEDVVDRFRLSTATEPLFPDLAPVPVPDELRAVLADNTPLAFLNEKSRSEFVVVPVLRAVVRAGPPPLSLYSGHRLDIDRESGLVGECDFIVAAAPPVLPLRGPVATLVEAKKADIELGYGQCLAQMVGIGRLHLRNNLPDFPVYGCVTTGELWQFVRLTGLAAVIDRRRYFLTELDLVLAAFGRITRAAPRG